jgi:hypothetical protein
MSINLGSKPERVWDAVQVAVRVRPMSEEERAQKARSCVEVDSSSGSVRLEYGSIAFKDDKQFVFDFVYGTESRQHSLFDDLGLPQVEAVLQGFSTCVLAYGAAGSGKTYCMTGTRSEPGLATRIICHLFDRLAAIKAKKSPAVATVSVSYLEIYNETLRDLLPDAQHPVVGPQRRLEIRESGGEGVHVKGLAEWHAHSPEVITHCLPLDYLTLSVRGVNDVGGEGSRR